MTGPSTGNMASDRRARQTVASFKTYPEAQRAVDFLSDQKFPVARVAIVAEGLRFVEQVTGRRNWGSALLSGAASGALVGALIGFLFGLFSFVEPVASALTLALYGLLFGALIGGLFGMMTYAFSGGQRDFNSVSGMQAERYDVQVDAEVAAQAEQILARLPGGARGR